MDVDIVDLTDAAPPHDGGFLPAPFGDNVAPPDVSNLRPSHDGGNVPLAHDGDKVPGPDSVNVPPAHGLKVSDADLAVGVRCELSELKERMKAYAAERHFRFTSHHDAKRAWILFQCQRSGLSRKQIQARRQSGDMPPKRKARTAADVIVLDDSTEENKNEGDEKKQPNLKNTKPRNRISMKCGCAFKIYAKINGVDCVILTSSLTHTNGCRPCPAFEAAADRARGLRLDASTIAMLKTLKP